MTAHQSQQAGMSRAINRRAANVFGMTSPVGGEHAS